MGYFERRFVRPTHLQVVEALEEAARAAAEGQTVLVVDDREQWDAFLGHIRGQAEGCQQWTRNAMPHGAGVAGVAWWTDYLGRRHFRIWAGASSDDSFRQQFHPERDLPPPVWHIAPDRVFGRTRRGQRDWIAVCPCGAAGAPQSVGWMGDRCGRCHDQPDQAKRDASVHFASLSESCNALSALAFSPDGRRLAGVGQGRNIHVWDIDLGGLHRQIRPVHPQTCALTFTPDGDQIAAAGGDRMLRFYHAATGEETAAYPTPKDVTRVAIAPDNLTLAIAGNGMLEVWGRPVVPLPWLPTVAYHLNAHSLAFNHVGDRLAEGEPGGWVRMYGIAEAGGRPMQLWAHACHGVEFPDLTFSRNDHALLMFELNPGASGGRSVSTWAVDESRTYARRILSKTADRRSRISPDGGWLASIQGSVITLESIEVEGRCVQLESAPGAKLVSLAFSPDGQTLATADDRGVVKLWPWRRLLEA